jgi:hypothetical protein
LYFGFSFFSFSYGLVEAGFCFFVFCSWPASALLPAKIFVHFSKAKLNVQTAGEPPGRLEALPYLFAVAWGRTSPLFIFQTDEEETQDR